VDHQSVEIQREELRGSPQLNRTSTTNRTTVTTLPNDHRKMAGDEKTRRRTVALDAGATQKGRERLKWPGRSSGSPRTRGDGQEERGRLGGDGIDDERRRTELGKTANPA
jgi:hypothetical protein